MQPVVGGLILCCFTVKSFFVMSSLDLFNLMLALLDKNEMIRIYLT